MDFGTDLLKQITTSSHDNQLADDEWDKLSQISDEEILDECKSILKGLPPLPVPQTCEQEIQFSLDTFGFFRLSEDGNSLLHSVSYLLWRTQAHYNLLRRIVVARLNLRRDLYQRKFSNKIYDSFIEKCNNLDCPTPLIALEALADAFEVKFVMMFSWTPFVIYNPLDPTSTVQKVLYLCETKESDQDQEVGHCDAMLPRDRPIHEPLIISEKAAQWMKKHKLLSLEDTRLFQSSIPSKQIPSPRLEEPEKRLKVDFLTNNTTMDLEKQLADDEWNKLSQISDEEILDECKSILKGLPPIPVSHTCKQERQFRLDTFGFVHLPIDGDGNCVLRSVSYLLWRTQAHYNLLRRIVVARLKLRRDLYQRTFSNKVYDGLIDKCCTLDCPTPLIVLEALADAFEVKFAVMISWSSHPFVIYNPLDPTSTVQKVLYLCLTKESDQKVGHCDAMLPRDRPIHEPLVISEKATQWMKKHKLLILEDTRLFQSSSPSKPIPSPRLEEPEKSRHLKKRKFEDRKIRESESEAKLNKHSDHYSRYRSHEHSGRHSSSYCRSRTSRRRYSQRRYRLRSYSQRRYRSRTPERSYSQRRYRSRTPERSYSQRRYCRSRTPELSNSRRRYSSYSRRRSSRRRYRSRTPEQSYSRRRYCRSRTPERSYSRRRYRSCTPQQQTSAGFGHYDEGRYSLSNDFFCGLLKDGNDERKGAFAVYLEPWHTGVFSFMDLSKIHGKEEQLVRGLFYDCWGQEFETLYTQYKKQEIHTLVQSLHFSAIEIKTINHIESWRGGIVVVSGSFRSKFFSGWRKFVQTFFLAPQESGYFVMNDIFHFISKEANKHFPVPANNHLPASLPAGHRDDYQPVNSTSQQHLVPKDSLEIKLRESFNTLHLQDHYQGDYYTSEQQQYQQQDEEYGDGEKYYEEEPPVKQPFNNHVDYVQESLHQNTAEYYQEPLHHDTLKFTLLGKSVPSAPTQAPVVKSAPPTKERHQKPEPVTSYVPETTVMMESAVNEEGELLSANVRNLPTSVTSQEIYQEFKNFGKITQDGVFLKNRLDVGVCFAFVDFEDVSGVHKAIEFSPIQLAGRQVYIEERRAKQQWRVSWRKRKRRGKRPRKLWGCF